MYDVSFLDNLKILDLEGNNVREIEALYSLGNCRHLESLTLGLNPISKEPNYERVT
jgi:Leucine-rich repeat (LRR) protein